RGGGGRPAVRLPVGRALDRECFDTSGGGEHGRLRRLATCRHEQPPRGRDVLREGGERGDRLVELREAIEVIGLDPQNRRVARRKVQKAPLEFAALDDEMLPLAAPAAG